MKILLLFLSLCITGKLYAQTGKAQVIAGTRYSLIPPDGFKSTVNFAGFFHEATGASIMVNEIPGPYATIAEAMTVTALQKQGMTLLDKQTIEFKGGKATLIKASQTASGVTYLKQLLLFGDEKNTVMVNGIYPAVNRELEGAIKAAVLSTTYTDRQAANPMNAAMFSVDVNGTDFQFAKYLSGALLYSVDGQIPTDKPFFTVAPTIMKVNLANRKQYSIERLKKLPRGESTIIDKADPIEIDGLKGYEILAKGKSKEGGEELVYSVMLFNQEGDYYIFIGMAKEDFEKRLQDFKKIARTFQVKRK